MADFSERFSGALDALPNDGPASLLPVLPASADNDTSPRFTGGAAASLSVPPVPVSASPGWRVFPAGDPAPEPAEDAAAPELEYDSNTDEELNDETAWFEGNRLLFRPARLLARMSEGERLEIHRAGALCRITAGELMAGKILEAFRDALPEDGTDTAPAAAAETFTVVLTPYRAERLRETARFIERSPEEVLNLLTFGMPDTGEMQRRLESAEDAGEEERSEADRDAAALETAHDALEWLAERLEPAEGTEEPRGHPRAEAKRESARLLVLEAERLLEAAAVELSAALSLTADGREAA